MDLNFDNPTENRFALSANYLLWMSGQPVTVAPPGDEASCLELLMSAYPGLFQEAAPTCRCGERAAASANSRTPASGVGMPSLTGQCEELVRLLQAKLGQHTPQQGVADWLELAIKTLRSSHFTVETTPRDFIKATQLTLLGILSKVRTSSADEQTGVTEVVEALNQHLQGAGATDLYATLSRAEELKLALLQQISSDSVDSLSDHFENIQLLYERIRESAELELETADVHISEFNDQVLNERVEQMRKQIEELEAPIAELKACDLALFQWVDLLDELGNLKSGVIDGYLDAMAQIETSQQNSPLEPVEASTALADTSAGNVEKSTALEAQPHRCDCGSPVSEKSTKSRRRTKKKTKSPEYPNTGSGIGSPILAKDSSGFTDTVQEVSRHSYGVAEIRNIDTTPEQSELIEQLTRQNSELMEMVFGSPFKVFARRRPASLMLTHTIARAKSLHTNTISLDQELISLQSEAAPAVQEDTESSLISENVQLKQQLMTREAMTTLLQHQLLSKDSSFQVELFRNQSRHLNTELKACMHQSSTMSRAIQELKSQNSRLARKARAYNCLKQRLRVLNASYSARERVVDELKQELERQKLKTRLALKEARDQRKHVLTTLTELAANGGGPALDEALRAQILTLDGALKQAKTEQSQVASKLVEVRRSLIETERQLTDLRVVHDDSLTELAEKKLEHERSQEAIAEYLDRIQELEDLLKAEESLVEESEKHLNEATQSNQQHMQEIHVLKNEVVSYQENIGQVQSEKQLLLVEKSRLEEELCDRDKTILGLQEDQEELQRLREHTSLFQESFNKMFTDQAEPENFNVVLTQLEQEIGEKNGLEETSKNQQTLIFSLKEETEAQKQELETLASQLQTALQTAEATQGEVSQLQGKLRTLNSENEELQMQNSKLVDLCCQAQTSKKTKEAEHKQAQAASLEQIQSLKEANESLQEDLAEAQQKLVDHQHRTDSVIRELNETLISQRQALEEANNKIAESKTTSRKKGKENSKGNEGTEDSQKKEPKKKKKKGEEEAKETTPKADKTKKKDADAKPDKAKKKNKEEETEPKAEKSKRKSKAEAADGKTRKKKSGKVAE